MGNTSSAVPAEEEEQYTATPEQSPTAPPNEDDEQQRGPSTAKKSRADLSPHDQALQDIAEAKIALIENYQHIAPLKGKDVALFVGNTGAGKSTTVNYLVGKQMERSSRFGRTTYDCADPATAIGHGFGASCTQYPRACGTEGQGLFLVDCPGFRDNRGVLAETLCNLFTYSAIQLASAVRAIALVIDEPSITAVRGEQIKALLHTVANLITLEHSDQHCPIVFCLTKTAPGEDPVAMRDHFLHEVIPSLQQGLPEDIRAAAELLFSIMQRHPENVFVVSPEDAQQRSAILERVLAMPPIAKPRFRLVATPSTRTKLHEILDNIASAGLPMLKGGLHVQGCIQAKIQGIAGMERELDASRDGLVADVEPQQLLEQCLRELRTLSAQLQHAKDTEAALGDREAHITATLEAHVQDAACADDVLFWSESFNDSTFFFRPRHRFVYPGRVPFSFVRIQSVGENADRFFDEHKDAANGEYAVSYEVVDRRRLFNVIPFCPQPARAKVEVFIRKGEHPKVVAVTQALTQDLDHVTEERAVARRTYHRMRDEVIALQRVTEEHRDVIATHEQRKAALHSKIETLTGQLTEEVGALAELRKDLELRSVAIKQVESDLELAKGLSEIVGRQLDGEGPEDNEAGAWCNQTAELAQLWDTFWSGQATAQGWQGAGQVLKLEGPKD